MKKARIHILLMFRLKILMILLFTGLSVSSQNPLIRDIGMSDPHVRIFNDTIFLFTGHDDHPDDKLWVMKEWRIFSSTDLNNWELRNTISPADSYMGSGNTDCWAGDASSRNGKYYFYFSDRKRSVGVMTSDTPAGKYKDALGKPLVSPMHDPTILIDDDKNKTPYLIYGDKEGGGYHVAKLNENMVSLAETPKLISISGAEWENAPIWMDKNYIFKHKGTFYLSWGRDYATSKNVYGPYTCTGSVGNGHHLDEFAHGSFFNWGGQFYHIWTYYIRPGYKYRECIISYCHMDDNGKIVTDTDFLDKHFEYGVARFDASWPEIQAEWFSGKSEDINKTGTIDSGFFLANLKKQSWVKFANVDFGEPAQNRILKAMFSENRKPVDFQIRLDSPSGKVISKGFLKKELSNNERVVSVDLESVGGVNDIYFVFTENSGSKTKFDRFQIVTD